MSKILSVSSKVKVISAVPATNSPTAYNTNEEASDCRTVITRGGARDGVYQLNIGGEIINVFCSNGFVTLQKRFDGSQRFDRTFKEYEEGIGSAAGEHWLGLRFQHEMTKSGSCTFRALFDVDTTSQYNKDHYCYGNYAADCDGKVKEVVATGFRISSASDKYSVRVHFNSTDFLHPDVDLYFFYFSGQFSSKDSNNDKWSDENCATEGEVGGGFWYYRCEPGLVNSVWTKSDPYYCGSSNKVCGNWSPYLFKSSLLQFSC